MMTGEYYAIVLSEQFAVQTTVYTYRFDVESAVLHEAVQRVARVHLKLAVL